MFWDIVSIVVVVVLMVIEAVVLGYVFMSWVQL